MRLRFLAGFAAEFTQVPLGLLQSCCASAHHKVISSDSPAPINPPFGYLDAQIPSSALLPHFESLRVEGYVYKDSVPINMNPCIGVATIQAVCSEVISRNDKKSRGHWEKLAEPLKEKAQTELGHLIVIVHLVSEEKIAADMLPESKGITDSSTASSQSKDRRVITQSDSFGNEQAASEVSTKRIRPLFTIKA